MANDEIQCFGSEVLSPLHVEGKKPKAIIVDCSGVKDLSSAVLGKLITVQRLALQKGVRFFICNVDCELMDIFKIASLDGHYNFQKDRESALQAAREGIWAPGINYK